VGEKPADGIHHQLASDGGDQRAEPVDPGLEEAFGSRDFDGGQLGVPVARLEPEELAPEAFAELVLVSERGPVAQEPEP
jgi:hypothetical protein